METVSKEKEEKFNRRLEITRKINKKLESFFKDHTYLGMRYRKDGVEHECCGINNFFKRQETFVAEDGAEVEITVWGYILNGKERMQCELVDDFNEEQLNEILEEVGKCIASRYEVEANLDRYYSGEEPGYPNLYSFFMRGY